jgi:hypothetical protein
MVVTPLGTDQFQRFLSEWDRLRIFACAVELADALVKRGELIVAETLQRVDLAQLRRDSPIAAHHHVVANRHQAYDDLWTVALWRRWGRRIG